MIRKADGQRIHIEFDQEILGDVALTHTNSNWIPSSFTIIFSAPQYVPEGPIVSFSRTPNAIEFAPTIDIQFDFYSGSSTTIDIHDLDYVASIDEFVSQAMMIEETDPE